MAYLLQFGFMCVVWAYCSYFDSTVQTQSDAFPPIKQRVNLSPYLSAMFTVMYPLVPNPGQL